MRRTRLGTSLAALCLALTACGGDDGDDGTGAATTDPAAETAAGDTGTADETGTGGGGTATSTDAGQAAPGCDTVTIGSLHPLTGGLALDGQQMDDAVSMAAEDLSADSGVTVEVLSADTQGAPEVGQTEAQRLIQEGANALVGAFQSAVTINLATVAQREQVPLVIDVAVSDEITSPDNPFTFRIQPNATAMGQFGARYIAEVSEAQGTPVETVAYMHEETSFGQSVYDAFAAEAESLGIEIAETIVYNAFEVQDVTTELQRVASAQPDALVVTGYYNDGVLIAETAASVQPPIAGIFGVAQGAFDLPQFPQDAPDASDGIFDSNYHFDATKERVNDIRSRFEEQYGDAMRTAAVLAYQAVEVIVEAAEQAEGCDGQQIRDAIAEVSVAEPLLTFPGPIEFGEDGENVNAQPVLMQVQDGEIQQVHPQEFAESEPTFPAVPWGAP